MGADDNGAGHRTSCGVDDLCSDRFDLALARTVPRPPGALPGSYRQFSRLHPWQCQSSCLGDKPDAWGSTRSGVSSICPPASRKGGRVERRIDAPLRGRLFQEDLLSEPFWLLLACSMVNLTNWEAARPIHASLMARYTVADLAALDPEDLQDDLQPLGLWRRRSLSTVRLARAWLERPPERAADVLRLPGCGKYASDSWAIFLDGRTDVDAHDGKLLWYLTQLKERRDGRGQEDAD